MLREIGQDVRHGLRVWRRKPLITFAILLSLILGLATNAAVFTVLDVLFLRPLPAVGDMDRLLYLYWTDLANPDPETPQRWSFEMARRLGEEVTQLSSTAARQRITVGVRTPGGTERVSAVATNANYFDTLGLTPTRGRFFSAEEDRYPGPAPVAVLSHGLWNRVFGSDPDIVGKDIEVSGVRFEVVGVGPPRFQGPEVQNSVDMWLPIGWFPELSPFAEYFHHPTAGVFDVIARLPPGVTAAQAGAELEQVGNRLLEEFNLVEAGVVARAMPLYDITILPRERQRFERYAKILTVAVLLVLLLSMVNVGHLLLVHGFDRAQEVATRQAVGASRGRLARQILTETLLLFVIGGLAAWFVAWGLVRLLWSQRPPEFVANTTELAPDGRVLLFLFALTLLTGVLTGLLPALRSSRVDLVSRLKGTAPPTEGRGRRFDIHDALVVPQLSLALAAILAGGLFHQNLQATRSQDLGFEPEPLAVVTVYPGMLAYDAPRTRAFYDDLLREVRALPGVQAAALGSDRLLRGGVARRQVYRPGEDVPAEGDERGRLRSTLVTPGFFDMAGLRLAAGSDFTPTHGTDEPGEVVLNRFAVEDYLGHGTEVGDIVHFDDLSTPPLRIVGITETAQYRDIGEDPQGFIYIPMGQDPPPEMVLHVRTSDDPAALLPRLRDVIRRLDPDMPFADLATMESYVDEALWVERASTRLFNAFSLLALVLAVIGVYGVIRYSVRRREKEIAIRRALGAERRRVVADAVLHGAKVAVVGLVLGLLVGWFVVVPWVASTDPEAPAPSWLMFVAPTLVLLVVALAGSLLPALRAARVEPARAFRDA